MIIDTPEGIEFFQMCALEGAIKLEMKGLKRRGRSAYAIAKEKYGLRGSRARVQAQLKEIIEKKIADRA
jgi:hypothetical protein